MLGHPQIHPVSKAWDPDNRIHSTQWRAIAASTTRLMFQSTTFSVRLMMVGDHPVINHPGGKHRRHAGQVITRRPGDMIGPDRPAPADVQRRRQLSGHLLIRVGAPQRALDQLRASAEHPTPRSTRTAARSRPTPRASPHPAHRPVRSRRVHRTYIRYYLQPPTRQPLFHNRCLSACGPTIRLVMRTRTKSYVAIGIASGAGAHLLGVSVPWSVAIGLIAPIALAAAPRFLLATVKGAFTPVPERRPQSPR